MNSIDLEARLAVSQDERRVLLERSLSSENKTTKLLADNGVLTKKIMELEAALQEIAREYQALHVITCLCVRMNHRRLLLLDSSG